MKKIKRTAGFILNHPLGHRHLIKAFTRFFIWQLQSRLRPSKFFIKPFIGNIFFYGRSGLTGITGNIYTGLHEFNDMAFLLHFLRPDDLFLDVGANVGSYTLLGSGIAKARTIALEASSETAGIMAKNIALNKLQHLVELLHAAAGAAIGVKSFSKNEDTTNHIISESEGSAGLTELVNVTTVDTVCGRVPPLLVKIDVEGFETEVLKGMTSTLSNPVLKAIIIELNGSGVRYGFSDHAIHLVLSQHGFKPHIYAPFERTLTALESFGDYNTIYCRDMAFIDQRLSSADAISIMGEKI